MNQIINGWTVFGMEHGWKTNSEEIRLYGFLECIPTLT